MLRINTLVKILAILIFLFSITSPVQAENNIRLRIETLKDENFPALEVFVSVTDVLGFPVKGLTEQNFSLAEDGFPVSSFKVSSFANSEQPLAFVLLIDTSGSMAEGNPSPLEQAKVAAKNFISGLSPQDKVAIIPFNDQVNVAAVLSQDKDNAGTTLDGLKIGGGTAIYDAILQGVDLLKTSAERRVMILITDGKESGASQHTRDEAINEAVRWTVPVYPIGFGNIDRDELQRISEATAGATQISPDASTLQSGLTSVVAALREQYRLELTSSLPADGKQHTLMVGVEFEGWKDEDTQQFLAPLGEVSVWLPGYENDQELAGKALFVPQITSPSPIKRLDITINGEPAGYDTTEPFEFEWDATQLTPGSYTLSFVAQDEIGNSGETTVHLVVRSPITLEMRSPDDGSEIKGSVPISAVVDTFASLDRIEVWIDGQLRETLPAQISDNFYETSWDLNNVDPGMHTIKILAHDVLGNQAEAQAQVLLRPDQLPAQDQEATKNPIFLVLLALILLMVPITILTRRSVRQRLVTPENQGASGTGNQAVLTELEGISPGKTWQLTAGVTRLGRKASSNDIVLKGVTASRQQALIRFKSGEFVIESVQPENPILVNDKPVDQPRILLFGDIIRGGESMFRFDR
jgi:VWFA-related protein